MGAGEIRTHDLEIYNLVVPSAFVTVGVSRKMSQGQVVLRVSAKRTGVEPVKTMYSQRHSLAGSNFITV
ncbi:MAG TPA: hypothetical protein DIW81_18850 [Planctomycetaceae bacterium]|nr:hypothetical protein [Rubinisphaera sp.]HCS53620.1 hypothetical protein [Planctomycetaceae bacterium]|tara:strand:+ start:68 stop:274 length:207 start_codon:yes stop_codon:yes gene_type:complete